MKVNQAFKQRIFELCKLNNISFSMLCKNCKINKNRLFIKNRGLNIKILKKICAELKITTKQFFDGSYFENLEF